MLVGGIVGDGVIARVKERDRIIRIVVECVMVNDRVGDPKKRTPPTAQFVSDGSSVTQLGWELEPLPLICQPLIVMWLLFSTSIAPV
jgi:hypothetical protein